LKGLKDKSRSGRPPSLVTNDLMIKIRKELEDGNTRWDFRQVMDIIQKRASIKYPEVHIYIDCCINGVFCKGASEKICKNRNSRREKEFYKRIQDVITDLKMGWHILVQDEPCLYMIYA
jgi:hypothetical protein